MDIEAMKKEVDMLQKLLEAEQTGLFTWHEFLHEKMEKLCLLYYGDKFPEK